MNKHVNAKLEMYQRVLGILEQYESTWNVMPAYVTAWSKLSDTVNSIEAHIPEMYKPITGHAEQKRRLRAELITLVRDASTLITAFARIVNDAHLQIRNEAGKTALLQMGEADFKLHVSLVLEDIDHNLGVLSDYGITQAQRDQLSSKFNEWSDMLKAPRKAINERMNERFNIQELMKSADALLHDILDKLMLPYQTAEPAFYFQYRSARKIIETRGRNDDIGGSGGRVA
jgi:hypothetical protein